MAGEASIDRRYSEKEIRAILQRAGELQANLTPDAGPPDLSAGVSLAQLQQAAAELGLDPGLIAQAANDIAEEGTGPGSRWLGGPWGVDADRLIPGMISEENWPFVVDEMRAATGRVGTPKSVGKAFEWLSKQPDPLHVTLTPRGASVRVRVTARFGEWAVVFCVLPAAPILILTVLLFAVLKVNGLLSPELLTGLVIGVPALSIAGARVAFGRLCARKRQQTYHLLARLEQAIRQSSQEIAGDVSVQDGVEAVPACTMITVSSNDEQPVTLLDRR